MIRELFDKLLVLPVVALARLGFIDRKRGKRTVDLAWPRILTGFTRQSQHAADLAMVGFVIGPAAIAGIAFARPYWSVAGGIGTAIANGSIVLISQRYGAEAYNEMDIAIKQSLIVSTLVALPIVVFYWFLAGELIGLLGASPEATMYGTTYLQVTGLAHLFKFPNKVAGRTLVGVDDAWTPMVFRAGGAVVNLVLNVIFIFGLGLGVFGAALGTLLAAIIVTLAFGVGFVWGYFPGIGELPVRVRHQRPFFDLRLGKQLLEISAPLVVRRMGSRAAQFPMLAIVSQFGTVIVAAYQVSRQIRKMMNTPNWGISLAASSLVGQELGRGDETEAESYGWDIFRFSTAIYVTTAVFVLVFARLLTSLFIQDPDTVSGAVTFVRIGAISAIGQGIDGVNTGTLRAGGDTRWPLYGRLAGLYGFTLPLAYLAIVTPFGIYALYLALVTETFVPALVTTYRFQAGTWKQISRDYRPGVSD